MKFWLTTFLLGQVIGLATDAFVGFGTLPLMAISLVGFVVQAPRWRIALLTMGGFLWGVANSAPTPRKNLGTAVVLRTNPFNAHNLVVETKDQSYLVTGLGRTHDLGRVTVRDPTSFLHMHTAYFANVLPQSQGFLAELLEKKLRHSGLPENIKAWLSCLFLGIYKDLTPDFRDAIKQVGLLHVVVISGMHVTSLSLLLHFLFLLIPRALYTLRLISPWAWPSILILVDLLTLVAVFFYCVEIGMPPPAQRAALLFVTSRWGRFFHLNPGLRQSLLLCFFAQAVIFPLGLLSTSSLLSWAAYLLVIAPNPGAGRWHEALCQLALSGMVAAVVGGFYLLGILVNLTVVRCFDFFFYSALLLVMTLGFNSGLTSLLVAIQEGFLSFVLLSGRWVEAWPWLFVDLRPENLLPIRIGCLVFAGIILLKTMRILTITKEGSLKEWGARGATPLEKK